MLRERLARQVLRVAGEEVLAEVAARRLDPYRAAERLANVASLAPQNNPVDTGIEQ